MVAVRMRRRRSKKFLLPLLALTTLALVILFLYLNNDANNLDNYTRPQRGTHSNESSSNNQWISPDSHPFNEYNDVSNANHLIMVAGHSVTVSGHLSDAGVDESDWFLLDYQKGKGLPQTIVAHIKEGIHQAALDPRSILIFSGGETRASAGPVNEGSSYFTVANAMNLWEESGGGSDGDNDGGKVRSRTTSEEFATDSFQNL